MRFVTGSLLLILFAVLTPNAQEPTQDFNTARGFYDKCDVVDKNGSKLNANESFRNGFCLGFAVGFTRGFSSGEMYHSVKMSDRLYCIPEGVNNQQVLRVIRKWIADHPESTHNAPETEAAAALHNAFPCAK